MIAALNYCSFEKKIRFSINQRLLVLIDFKYYLDNLHFEPFQY